MDNSSGTANSGNGWTIPQWPNIVGVCPSCGYCPTCGQRRTSNTITTTSPYYVSNCKNDGEASSML